MYNYKNLFLESIETEYSFYPSLGLVSKASSGSHKDMNWETFCKSFKTFEPMFNDIIENVDNIKDFYDLKTIGLKYEQFMFSKTKGINTHKGLIFHSSIFFYCFIYSKKYDQDFREFLVSFCEPLKSIEINSKSMKICKELNLKHPIQVAYEGYQIVFEGLNYFKEVSKKEIDVNIKYLLLIIYITIQIDDTTLLLKLSKYEFSKVKKDLKEFENNLLLNKLDNNEIKNINELFVQRNVSPGGAADLFVLVLFLYKVNYF